VETDRPVWKKPVPVKPPPREPSAHGRQIRQQVEAIVQEARTAPVPQGVDPALVLRVRTEGAVQEASWRGAGFTVVGEEANRTYLLFADDTALEQFLDHVDAYEYDRRRPGGVQPPNAWLAWIAPDGVGRFGAEDRQGPLLRDLLLAGGPQPDALYWLDVDLWDHGDRPRNGLALQQVERYIADVLRGRVTDTLLRPGLALLRAQVRGDGIPALLGVEPIYQVDLPPRLAHSADEVRLAGIDDVSEIGEPAAEAPRLCVIDSGVARGHPLLEQVVEETTACPVSLGDGLDVHGHGTEVAGVAVYGDVEGARRSGRFLPRVKLDSARVTNAEGRYDDERLIASQMDEAIRTFAAKGCRLFVLAQGDDRLVYRGGRMSSWAAMLDNLAREHDVLILVSAGNHDPDLTRQAYPMCFEDAAARIIEPAPAVNVITVGAISAGGLPRLAQRYPGDVPPQPVAGPGQPAPFTRRGPGLRGAVKPELVHYGGNYSHDPRQGRYGPDAGLGVVTLHWNYLERPFTISHGTSLSVARAAHAAAAVAERFPQASANLWKALLVDGAKRPGGTEDLALPEDVAIEDLVGYGLPDEERSLWSSDARVTMFAQDELAMDRFHMYGVPIPREFRDTGGDRRVSVTLAFDPPVARRYQSRYTGNRMSFDLIRGMDPDAVIAAYAKPSEDVDAEDLPDVPDSKRCLFFPRPQRRGAGTVQRGVWQIKRNTALHYDEPFWLLVRCLRNWQPFPELQRYALVVTLEHLNPDVRLYAALEARVQAMVRARV